MQANQLRDKIIASEVFRRNVFNLVPEGASRVLDFGCGTGALALRLQRDKGCSEIYGVEIHAELIRDLAKLIDGTFSVNIERRNESLDPRFRDFFKYIILHDVVEHFYDPWFALSKLRAYLAPEGRMLIATPNFHYWELQHTILCGDFPYGPGLWHTGHLRWYTVRSLLELVTLCGFTVESIYLEIPDTVDLSSREQQQELTAVHLPPVELAERYPDRKPLVLSYPSDVKAYYPAFLAHKLIFVCGNRKNFVVEPGEMVYNCARLQQLRNALDNPFDVFNPPAMTPLIGNWC
jgi:SAM-dependent methyltransferase